MRSALKTNNEPLLTNKGRAFFARNILCISSGGGGHYKVVPIFNREFEKHLRLRSMPIDSIDPLIFVRAGVLVNPHYSTCYTEDGVLKVLVSHEKKKRRFIVSSGKEELISYILGTNS